jgi:hypothetical protein
MNLLPPIIHRMLVFLRCPTTNAPPQRSVAAVWLAILAGGVLLTQSGCTTLLTAGGLQEAFHDAGDASAVASYDADAGGADEVVADDRGDLAPVDDAKPIDPAAAEEALDAALEQLAATGRLTAVTEDALTAAVEGAPPQDWPDIINAFVATIESTPAPQRTAMRPVDAPVTEEAEASPEIEQTADPKPASESATEQTTGIEATGASLPSSPNDLPSAARLSVVNACFASRVRGWGSVERFASSRFQPGQELIVYFELEDLVGDESPEGHTTRIDTTLQLISDDGQRLHEWRFEPLEETCRTPRRDYFARYVVRIPENLPAGACRLDLAVTDAVAHATAHASLPLEIADR